jgi:hypothetical protein
LTVRPLLERLGLGQEEVSRHDLELTLGRIRALDAATAEVEALRRANGIDDHLAEQLLAGYRARREELRHELDRSFHADALLEEGHRREIMRRLLRVQHEAAREAFSRGQIGQGVLRQLTAEIDAELGHLDVAPDVSADVPPTK